MTSSVRPDLEHDLETVETSEMEVAAKIMLRTKIINSYERHQPARIITLDNGPVSEVVFPVNDKWICYLSIVADTYKFRAVNLNTAYMTDVCANMDEIQKEIEESWPPSAR